MAAPGEAETPPRQSGQGPARSDASNAFSSARGEKVVGSWANGQLNGEARVFHPTGVVSVGRYSGNKLEYVAYKGQMNRSGQRSGHGTLFIPGTPLIHYEGSFAADKFEG